jgi:hypothetical protein
MVRLTDVAKDTRSSKRFAVALELELRRGDALSRARMRNLSIGGLSLEADEKLAAGEKLQLRFRIPGQREPVEVMGIVRWQDGTDIGVQFDGLRARDVWALGKYFESL